MTDATAFPHDSPSHSYEETPTLERLVTHFLAAKRSLSSTDQVYRANEIVNGARSHIEESAVLQAKNTFLRKGVDEEVHALHSVRDGLDTVGRTAELEFKAVIESLDIANDRLQATLTSLRNTIIDPSLNPQSPRLQDENDEDASPPGSHEEIQKTLHDFIDESTHLNLLDSLRATIDSYNDAQASLQNSQSNFDDSLSSLDEALAAVDELSIPQHYDQSVEQSQEDINSIPSLFHSLTTHAAETASLLQSLISHYDLCVTALKHTEGGGAAALAATTRTNPEEQSPVEESLYREKVREPMSDEERTEMLQVLETDAGEVSDVMLEIRERLSEMEISYNHLQSHALRARRAHKRLASVLSHLSSLGTSLGSHVVAARTFRHTWSTLKSTIVARTEELANLADFYISFQSSYSSLLKEVTRRQMVENKMRKIAEKARREIEALWQEDRDMREQFVNDVGEYLPRDIWPGLVEAPKRWEVRTVSGEGEEMEGDK